MRPAVGHDVDGEPTVEAFDTSPERRGNPAL